MSGFNSESAEELKALEEKQSDSEEIFDGVVLHVMRDTVTLPDGKDAVREVIRHVGAVCIIPITDDGKVIVERQFRYPAERVVTEIPAGKLNSRDEDRLSAAQRELREETGYTADEWINMGDFYPAIAYSDERITMFLAKGLHRGEQELDEDEFLSVGEVPLNELVDEVMAGRIPDLKTQSAIMRAAVYTGLYKKN